MPASMTRTLKSWPANVFPASDTAVSQEPHLRRATATCLRKTPKPEGQPRPVSLAAAIPGWPLPSPVLPSSAGAWPASPNGGPAAKICGSGRAGGPGAVLAGVADWMRFRAKK